MTTPNHTAIAGTVAILTTNSPLLLKISIIVGLVLSHIFLDLIPHLHYGDFEKFKEQRLRVSIELGLGLIIVFVIWQITHINLLWLVGCAFAANLFDFITAGHIFLKNQKPSIITRALAFIARINHLAHWWKKYIHDKAPSIVGVTIEIIQTGVVLNLYNLNGVLTPFFSI